MKNYPVVDVHTHINPPDVPNWNKQFGKDGFLWIKKNNGCGCGATIFNPDGSLFRKIEDNCFDPKARIPECDTAKVDVQVLSPVPGLGFNYDADPEDCFVVAKHTNDHLASVVKENPKRFVGLGTLPMQAPKLAIKELHRIKEIGLVGVEIGSHIESWNLDHPDLMPVYQEMEKLDMALFVHPWDMEPKERLAKHWSAWLVGMPFETSLAIFKMITGGVFDKVPGLKVCFAHGGGSFPVLVGRWNQGYRMRGDLVATDCQKRPEDYLGHFWVDSLVHNPLVMDLLMKLVGPEKIVLGTDYPFPLGELYEPVKEGGGLDYAAGRLVRSMKLDEKTEAQILGLSALDWLGLEAEQFVETKEKVSKKS